MSTLLQLNISDELLKRLDHIAKERLAKDTPPSIGQWVSEHPDGRECYRLLSSQPHWLHCPTEEYQAFIKESYHKSVGKRPTGRPPIGKYRQQIFEEALEAFLTPKAVTAPKKPSEPKAATTKQKYWRG
jgi:hypothetical protein